MQSEVDKLRNDLKISDVGEGAFMTTLEPETVRNIERDRISAEGNYVQFDTLLKELKKKSRQELRHTIPTAFKDEHLDRHLSELATAEQRYAMLIKDYSEDHPDVERVVSLIATLNKQIKTRLDGVLDGLEVTVATRKKWLKTWLKLTDAKAADAENMKNYRPYFVAKRDLETQQKIRDSIILRILQETVDEKLPKTKLVTVIDAAEEAMRPVRPNIPLNLSLGVIVGLIMGFGLAFFIEYLDTSVKTIDDVERSLQAPVLGVIPQNVGSLIDEGPDSPHAEAYRVLRTNVMFSRKDTNLNSLTVVSGGAGEGKSTTIFNLSVVFAQNGHRILLVDSDLRRPSLHKMLNVSNSIGLTNYLLRQNSLEEVIQPQASPRCISCRVASCRAVRWVFEFGANARVHQTAKARYDFVFFDSPPIMGVSDASIWRAKWICLCWSSSTQISAGHDRPGQANGGEGGRPAPGRGPEQYPTFLRTPTITTTAATTTIITPNGMRRTRPPRTTANQKAGRRPGTPSISNQSIDCFRCRS